ncbi:hypothetical protein [Pseudoalteromonas umbrosa]|uniref:hypothetical protein n=1 Tax=Pseudoalteromonas umbrosa TaxID=3048489 RepID=UPI0024C35036|nr:hypothetical protein [Pseudoalteromonas sp. B95]MDK1288511.1 hypothetical protein [Pseudoalteromonas sp. B95]
MFAGYSELLNELNSWLWLATIILPFLVLLTRSGNRSYFVVAAVWCSVQLLNLKIEGFLWETSKNNLIYWFGTWATIDALSIILVLASHKTLKIKLGFEAFSISICIAILALLQIGTYIDGAVLKTYLMKEAYTIGVNTGNLANALILSVPLLSVCLNTFKQRRRAM